MTLLTKNTKIREHSTAFGYLQITLAQNRIAEWQFPYFASP